jgi:hypothetical protein
MVVISENFLICLHVFSSEPGDQQMPSTWNSLHYVPAADMLNATLVEYSSSKGVKTNQGEQKDKKVADNSLYTFRN